MGDGDVEEEVFGRKNRRISLRLGVIEKRMIFVSLGHRTRLYGIGMPPFLRTDQNTTHTTSNLLLDGPLVSEDLIALASPRLALAMIFQLW